MPRSSPSRESRINALARGPVPVVVLLVLHLALGLSAVRDESLTFDETAHLGGGFSYWAANDYRLHAENGNWSQRWVALPMWWHGYKLPVEDPSWPISDVWGMTERLFATMGADADLMLWRGRVMMGFLSAGMGLLVYFWSRRIFGSVGGLISLTLYAFSPTMLANGFMATSDLPAAFFFLAASGALWALLHRVTPLTLVTALVSLAGVVLSKHSGVLIAPMAAILVVVRLWSGRPLEVALRTNRTIVARWRQALVFAAVAGLETLGVVLIMWASYGCRYSMFAPTWQEGSRPQIAWDKVEGGVSPRLAPLVQFARDRHLLPEGYLYGFSYTLLYANMRAGFLNGEFGLRGWTSFFPLCLAWKTPLTLFLMLLLGGWALWSAPAGKGGDAAVTSPRRDRLYALVPLAVLFAVYWIVAIRSNLNIGHRHILPTYAPMFIFAGATGLWFQSFGVGGRVDKKSARDERATTTVVQRPKHLTAVRVATVVALTVGMLEAVGFWPHYLAYFNVLAGGPSQGYRRLIDSSLDWGQDLPGLKRWLDDHPADTRNPMRVYISYFGTARPAQYGIRGQALPSFFPRWDNSIPQPLTGGVYCISASLLQGVYLVPFVGRWNEQYEKQYQEMRQIIEPFQRAMGNQAALKQMLGNAPIGNLQEVFRLFRVLRFARLCSYLRQREPDDSVGYSILIYRLSDVDVAMALDGPPSELLPRPEGEEDPTPP